MIRTIIAAIVFAIVCALNPSLARADGADTCSGASKVQLDAKPYKDSGTTTGKSDDYSLVGWGSYGDPAPGSAPDVVYLFDLPAGKSVLELRVQATSQGFDPAVYIRPACDDDYAVIDYSRGAKEVFVDEWDGGLWYVMIDGHGGSAGSYEITATASPPRCGDGVVSAGEQCDHAPSANDDGCVDPGLAGECSFETPDPAAEACPGQQVLVPQGTTVLHGSTDGYADDYHGTGGTCGGTPTGGSDRVYQLIPQVSGTLTASVGYEADGVTATCDVRLFDPACWDSVLWMSTSCGAPPMACSDRGFKSEVVTRAVTAGVAVFVGVDGYDGGWRSRGPFDLHLTLQ